MASSKHYLKKELYELVQRDSSIFEFLQSGSLDGIWYWDLERSENEWMSPQFWTTLGYDPKKKKHLASEWQDLINPDDLQTALTNFEKHCIDPNHPYDQVVRYRHKDGSIVWVRCRGIAIRDKTGKPVRMLGAHTDITQQKLAEQFLSESEKKYRNVFESFIDALFLIDVNTGKIIDYNPSALKLHQIETHDEFIGLTPYDLSPEFQPNGQSSKKMAMEYIDKAYKEGSAEFEWIHERRDGSKFPVLVTLSAISIRGKDLVLAFNRDLTELKEASKKREQLIRELQEALETLQRYERIIASTPDLISLVDKNYIYRLVNDAYLKIFNKKREEILDKSLVDLLGREFFQKHSKPNLDRAFAGETVNTEQTFTIPGKDTLHLAVTYHPVKNKDGDIDFVSLDARDVTDLKSFSDRLSLATNAGKIGIWEWNLLTNNLIWDETMLEIYKVKPDEFSAVYDVWRSSVHPDDLETSEEELSKAIEETKDFDSEFRIIWPDGQVRHIKAAAKVKTDEKGKAIRMIGVNSDITQSRELEAELRILATTDPLTGAHNRRYFMDRAIEEFERSMRYEFPFSIVALDIDHFKTINDTYGHPVGDKVLKNMVTLCKSLLRASDFFGRTGGEEFSIILPQTDLQGGWKIADRLREKISQRIVKTDSVQFNYTVSAGVSMIQPDDKTIESLLKRADSALYSAKEMGRNRVEKG